MSVQGIAHLSIVDDPREIAARDGNTGKPFIHVRFDNGVEVDITTNLAEMIGGAGAGTRQRWEARGGR